MTSCAASAEVLVGEQRDPGPEHDYRTARQTCAGVLIALVVVLVVNASLSNRAVDMPAVIALLATAAGFLAVDIPAVRR